MLKYSFSKRAEYTNAIVYSDDNNSCMEVATGSNSLEPYFVELNVDGCMFTAMLAFYDAEKKESVFYNRCDMFLIIVTEKDDCALARVVYLSDLLKM